MEEEIKIVVLGKDIPIKFRYFSFKDIVVILNLIIQSDFEMIQNKYDILKWLNQFYWR